MNEAKTPRLVSSSFPPPMVTLAISLSVFLGFICQAEAQHTLATKSLYPLEGSSHVIVGDTWSVAQRMIVRTSTSVSATTEEPFLTIQNNRISAWLENRPLSWVLQEVAAQSRVAIKIDQNMATFETLPVTVRFQDFPLDQGLRQLFKEVDAFYFYGAGGKEAAILQTVWVYPKGQGVDIMPVSPAVWDPIREFRANLTHADPNERITALKAIMKREGEKAEPYILEALKDRDASVRYQALQGAFRAGIDLQTTLLSDLLQYDSFHRTRFLALQALARDPETNQWLIELALNDTDVTIQTHARTLLEDAVVDPEDDHVHEGDEGHHDHHGE